MVANHLHTFAQAVGIGQTIISAHEEESIQRRGQNNKAIALSQFSHLHATYSIVNEALKACKKTLLSDRLYRACFVVPLILATGNELNIQNPYIRRPLHFLLNNLIAVSNLVTLVALGVLFAEGQLVFACSLICWVSLGLLAQRDLIPESTRRGLQLASSIVGNIASFATSGWIIKCLSAFFLFFDCFEVYDRLNPSPAAPKVETRKKETAEKIAYADLTDDKIDKCTVRPEYLQESVMPPVPKDVDPKKDLKLIFEKLSSKLEEFQKQDNLSFKMDHDRMWNRRDKSRYSENFEGRKKYLQDCLDGLLTMVMQEKIIDGTPSKASYARMQYMLRYITLALKNASPDLQADILIDLAVSGGVYCGPKQDKIITEKFISLRAADKTLSLRERFLIVLEMSRVALHESTYYRATNHPLIKYTFGFFIDFKDIHELNRQKIMVDMGLPDTGANDDMQRSYTRGDRFLLETISQWGGLKKIVLLPGFLARSIQEEVGTHLLPDELIVDWWQNWLKRNGDANLDNLWDSPPAIGVHHLYSYFSFLDSDGKYHRKLSVSPRMIVAMLVEMGIMQKGA